MLFTTTLFALALSVTASHDGHLAHRNHGAVAKRARGDLSNVEKRFDSARWTFYDVGLGACGSTSVSSDFIVALNSDQYGSGYPGPECFKTITMTYNGKTTQAVIMDECPGCPYGGLDLSRGLFDFFASEDEGVIYGTWNYGDSGSDDPTTTSTKHKETSTYVWVAPTTSSSEYTPEPTSTYVYTPPTTTKTHKKTSTTPTSTWEAPSTSSTPEWTSTSTSTKKKHTSTSTSSSSSAYSSSAPPSSSAAPSSVYSSAAASSSAVVADSGPQNLENLNEAVLNMAGLVVEAKKV